MSSIAEVLAGFIVKGDPLDWQELQETLTSREEDIKERLMLAGLQFGTYPFIVAEVLAEVGLGRPLSTDERSEIHRTYVEGMQELQRQLGGGE